MRALFCSLSSRGFTFPLIGLGKEAIEAGHHVAYVVGPAFSEILSSEGLTRIPRGTKDGPSFEVKSWADPLNVAMQIKHIEYALQVFNPDVIVTTHLTLGSLIAAELAALPVCIVGGVQYLLPPLSEDDNHPSNRNYNESEIRRIYNDVVRARLGLPAIPWDRRAPGIYGDALLLRSIPVLANNERLPDLVRFVGDCLWESRVPDLELARWLESSDKPCVYVQLGRNFDSPGNWPVIQECLKRCGFRAAVSTERFDTGAISDDTDDLFLRPHVPQGQVLPWCDFVITTGHPTAVLGALTHAKPMILLPNGSGTYDLSDTFSKLGIAEVIDGRTTDRQALEVAISRLTALPMLGSIRSEFQRFRGSALKVISSLCKPGTQSPYHYNVEAAS